MRDQEVAGGSHFRLAQNAPCVDHTRQKTPMGQRKRNKLARPFGAVLTELVFISKITAGSSIKIFGQFSAIFAEILPPPLWESQNFEKKFHFRGRSTSEFSLNWEGFSNFHTISVAFSKSHFFELSVTFFSQFR